MAEKQKEKKIRSDIVRDSLYTFGTNIIGTILGLVSSIFVLHRINPKIRGYYSELQTWGGGFNTILGLSIASAAIYFVAHYRTENSKGALKRFTIITFAIIAVGSTAVLVSLRDSRLFNTTPASYLVAILVYALLSLLQNVVIGALRGQNKFKMFNIITLTQRILATMLAIFIAFRPAAGVWIWCTNAISFAAIIMAIYGVHRWNGPEPAPAPENDHRVKTSSMVTYSLKSHVSNVLNYLNSNLGNFIVQGNYGISSLGVFSTALTIAQQLWLLPDAVSQVILSRVAAMSDQKSKLHLTLLSTKIVAVVTTIASLLVLWAAYLFIPWLFPMYVGVLPLLSYLIVGTIVISYAKVLGNSIAAYGRPELNVLPNTLGFAVNCIVSFTCIPYLHIQGVALATSLSMVSQGISCMVIFCKYSHTPFYRLLVPNREELSSLRRAFRG
jgi:O-antigen/teichoic acid export membrane protein